MSQRTVYPSLERPKTLLANMTEDEVLTYTLDMNSEVTRLGTSVSTAVWTTEVGNASVGSEALASNVATANITVPNEERALIKVVLTLADGQKFNQFIKLTIRDPRIHLFSNIRTVFGVP